MPLRWVVRSETAALAAMLLSFLASCSIQQYSMVVGSSVATNSMTENGATAISQECLPRRQRQIDVTEVFVVCDHQNNDQDSEDNAGESYTNRPYCRTGDLGKVGIAFTVRNELPYNSTIFMSMKAHYYERSATIRNRTDVCGYSNLGYINDEDGSFHSQSDGNNDDEYDGFRNALCPIQAGVHYMLFTSFTVQDVSSSSPSSYRKSSNWEFKPDLSMSFYLTEDTSSPLIGCVETGTKAKQALAQKRSKNGVLALFVSIVAFVTVFALSLHNQNQRKRAVELLENNRIASMIRRCRYRKSRSNGSVTNLSMDQDYFGDSSRNFHSMDHPDRIPTPSRDPPPPWR